MSSFAPDDVLLDIEKLETMLTNSSGSSCDSSSFSCQSSSPNSRSITSTARFTGSSKIYLRNLNKLLADIEQKQKILSIGGGSILKRLRPLNSSSSSSRSLTFTSLFPRPSIKCTSTNRLEPKTISFAQLITQSSSLPFIYSNHQSQYGCARLNEKMWVVHCREQLIKAVNTEIIETAKAEVSIMDIHRIELHYLTWFIPFYTVLRFWVKIFAFLRFSFGNRQCLCEFWTGKIKNFFEKMLEAFDFIGKRNFSFVY